MKNVILLVLGLFVFQAHAQEEPTNDSIPYEFNRQAFIYEMALAYNDPLIARMAVYNLISYNPGNSALLDTLSLMYFENNQIASAALTAQDAASFNPNDFFAVELAAIAFERLGVVDKAITFYEKLYTHNFDINTLYKLSFLQMQKKNFIESKANATSIVDDPKSKELFLLFPETEKKNQEITLQGATYRLLAMIENGQNNKDAAIAMYKKALETNPNFKIAKEELAELSK